MMKVLFLLIGCVTWSPVLTSSCSPSDDVCEFWLVVEHHLTMMHGRKAVFAENGKIYRYDVTNTSSATPIDPAEIIVADGWESNRIVAAVNGTMPGPAIIVYEGQTVIIHVKNKMTSAALTIHWHGLHQKGTPHMDGVAYITQCPILPYATFTYEFTAYPRGTFWYHSHIGTELSQGIVGSFIIRERNPQPAYQEHIFMITEWNHEIDAELMHMKMLYGSYNNREQFKPARSLEGGFFSNFIFQSGLINGRGRYYHEDGSHTQSPLWVFDVTQGQEYRFRIIGSGSLYPFRVSIDEHMLTVIASDGHDLQPVVVESLIINPGERYDVVVNANRTVGNYWVRGLSLEVDKGDYHIAEAILRYDGAPEEDPTSMRHACAENDRCLVLNCPFSYYPPEEYIDCMHLGGVHSHGHPEAPGIDEEVEDVFLNFAFPGTTFTPGSVNGRAFIKPPINVLSQPTEVGDACNSEECGEDKVCICPYAISLQANKVYQFVFLNMGRGKGWAHPIHMHGHTFHVVKMGYPEYNMTTGEVLSQHEDIDCGGNEDLNFCNHASWADKSWGGNNLPGINLDTAPMKDTIIVPTHGYAVVRIRADNPGVWFMHCHIELHNIDGMAVMLNESFGQHPAPPVGWQMCGDFETGTEHVSVSPQGVGMADDDDDDDNSFTKEEFWIAVGVLAGVIVLQFLIITCLLCRRNGSPSSNNLQGTIAGTPAEYHNSGFSNK